MKFELFQRVRITADYPEEHVTAGDEGVVMDTIPAKNDMPAGYSVELSSGHPHPLGVAMLTEKQLEKVSENGLVLNQLADEPKLLQILSILNEYAEVYSNNDSCSRSPQAFINGRPQNITDAGWLYYEGTSAWFPSKLLNEALPLLVMHVLVCSHDCSWSLGSNKPAVRHPFLKELITLESLVNQTWIQRTL